LDSFQQTMAFFEGPRRCERFGQAHLPAVFCRGLLAWCHAEQGTFADGRAPGDEGLQIAEAVGHPSSMLFGSWGGIEQASATPRVIDQAVCGLSLAEAHALAGRLEAAHTLAEHMLTLARRHQEWSNQAYALRLLGEIAAQHDLPGMPASSTPKIGARWCGPIKRPAPK
jgi:hypothetical protein